MRRAGSRTLSPLHEPYARPKLDPIPPKFIYERLIINKLEEYETLDQARLQDTAKDEQGSTLNFFRSKHKSNMQRIYQPLSVSVQKEARTLKLSD